MRVEVVRSGGFAGRVLRWEVDLEALPADAAAELRALLDTAPQWAPPEVSVPDGFSWRVVTDGPGPDLAFGEPGPEPAQRLVDLVRSSGATRP